MDSAGPQDHPRAGQQAAERRELARDVEERRVVEHDVVRTQPGDLGEEVAERCLLVVGQQDTFRRPGRARRVEHARDRVRLRAHQGFAGFGALTSEEVVVATGEPEHVGEGRHLLADLLDGVEQRSAVGDSESHLRRVQLIGEQLAAVGRVDRHLDRAQLRQREPAVEVLRARRHQQGDPAPLADPPRAQVPREDIDPGVDLDQGKVAAVVGEQDVLRTGLRRSLQQPPDGAFAERDARQRAGRDAGPCQVRAGRRAHRCPLVNSPCPPSTRRRRRASSR